jgi:4-amino-4-deoxy-L-arabinose transferase-like glycosyltransferase
MRVAVAAAAGLPTARLASPTLLAIATAAAGALSAVLLAALSARIFGRRGIALATGGLAAVSPTLVLAASEAGAGPLFAALLLSAGYLLLAATDRPSSNLAVLAGVFLALAALTRPPALALAPLLLAPLFERRHPLRANAHIAFSALFGFGAALAPWALHDANLFGGSGLAMGVSHADPRFWPQPVVLAAGACALFLLAGVGFARAPRAGVSAFCAAVLAVTVLVHVAIEGSSSDWAASWDPIVLLYAVSGAATLVAPRAERAPASG